MFPASHRIFARTAVVFLVCALPVFAQGRLFGHRHADPPGPCPTAVVLDFSVSTRAQEVRDCCTRELMYYEREVKTEKDRRGWWLGRQDLYFNSNVGRMAADLFADHLRDASLYNIISRGDLKYYYADKRDLIKKKLNLNGEALEKALLLLDPVAIGREMGVEKVIVGHICDSELRKGALPGSFASVASFQVAIFDVASGRLEYERCFRDHRNHSTQYFHYEKLAEEFGEEVRHHRGGQMVPAYTLPR